LLLEKERLKEAMKELIKRLYRFKIYITLRFNWGYSEISSYVAMVKDIAIILTGIVLVFKIHIGFGWSIFFCVFFFLLCVLGGVILDKTGMLKYGQSLTNQQNLEITEILELVRKHDNQKP
jgi:hypothetical protein